MEAGLIALIVLAVFVFIVAATGDPDHPAGARRDRRAARPLHPHARPGAGARHPVRRPREAADRPARAGRLLPAAAGDHRGQPRGRDRHRHLLHDHRPQGGHLRGRQPAAGDRAAHGHDAAQRDRRPDARGDADLARQHQLAAARRARRGDRQVGHPRQPRRAQVGRAAAHRPGGDGEADARRARPARHDPHRRGRQAVADPHRRGREAVGGAARPRAPGRRRSCAPRARRRRSRPSSRRSTTARPTSGCSPTSTCRCCRSSPRARPTRSS